MRIRSLILVTGLLAGAAAAPALAHVRQSPPPGRAGVQSATLVQSGRSLVWTVTLAHGISRSEIASGARSVCLDLETPRTRNLVNTVCLSAPAKRDRFGLTGTAAHGALAGRTHSLAGTVSRSHQAHTVTASFSPTGLGLPYRSLRWQVLSESIGGRCAGSANGAGGRVRGHRCSVTYPARAPLTAVHTPQLVGCTLAGRSLVYGGPSDKRQIALTFDDGPWWQPPSIDFVTELKRLGVVGTFFEIGDQISEYDPHGAVQRAMLADGDMIGNHTWTHPDMLTLSPAQQTTQLEQTNAAIRHATGFTPCLWRPPYGATDTALQSLARGLGMLTIDWNIDPRDWALPGTSAIVATVLREAQNGGIVEMHFGGGPRVQTLQALPQIVSDLRARGYRFVNLVQLLGLREIWH